MGFPVVFRINAHALDQLGARLLLLFLLAGSSLAPTFGFAFGLAAAAGGQVANMADTRLHHKLVAEVLVDCLGLGWRLHNDQCFSHGYLFS